MKSLRLLAVGKLKTPFWQQAAAHYMERLRHTWRVTETLVRDGDAALPPARRNADEGARLLAALGPADIVVCMDERGKAHTSREFAALLDRLTENATAVPCFVIGGAYGLDAAVLQRAALRVSLGPMTFPHEMARVVLLEQLYRADCILRGSPYHH
ncbi:23S rRNA (pseudouridine(1915)-N(3))-methyltransferase RlmH [Nitratidesulfovibrio sp. 1201_IL3209]|uniref:23S rRNA (pseudouridine(1915)-N(3))-methyltransferase RlmH n=1 Tax=Nitratidesulfovibrio sp. 1201_IL3209 TaxID=3084053 RepID=UPI002FD9E047